MHLPFCYTLIIAPSYPMHFIFYTVCVEQSPHVAYIEKKTCSNQIQARQHNFYPYTSSTTCAKTSLMAPWQCFILFVTIWVDRYCPLEILFLLLISCTQSEGQIYTDGEKVPTTIAPSDGSFSYERKWVASINFKNYHPGAYECIVANSYWNFAKSCKFPSIPYMVVIEDQDPTPKPCNEVSTDSPLFTTNPTCPPTIAPCEKSACKPNTAAKVFAWIFAVLIVVITAIFIWRLKRNAYCNNDDFKKYALKWIFGNE